MQTHQSKQHQKQEDAIKALAPAVDPLPVQKNNTFSKKNKEHQTPTVNEPYSIEALHTVENILGFGPTRPPNEPIKNPLTKDYLNKECFENRHSLSPE